MKLTVILLLLVSLPATSFGRPCSDSDSMDDLTKLVIKAAAEIDVSSCLAEKQKEAQKKAKDAKIDGVISWANSKWYCGEGFLHPAGAMLTVQRTVMMQVKPTQRSTLAAGTCSLGCADGLCLDQDDKCPFMKSLSMHGAVLTFGLSDLTIGNLKYNLGDRFTVAGECKDTGESAKVNGSQHDQLHTPVVDQRNDASDKPSAKTAR
jgi:hypothetical protein